MESLEEKRGRLRELILGRELLRKLNEERGGIQSLTCFQISCLSRDMIRALTGKQIACLACDQIKALTGEQLTWLTGEQLTWLTGDQVSNLTVNQLEILIQTMEECNKEKYEDHSGEKPALGKPNMEEFERKLTELINIYCIENLVDMPDFILAGMICRMIEAMGPGIKRTLDWHGCDSVCHSLSGNTGNTGKERR